MYLFAVPFLTLLCIFLQQHVVAELAPVSPEQDYILKHQSIHERQVTEDLSFCFGENSICSFSNNLYNQCQNYQEPYDAKNWYKCICGNGYVSVREA